MTDIIEKIASSQDTDKIEIVKAEVEQGGQIDAFMPHQALTNQSLIDFLMQYQKFKGLSLEDFIELGALQPNQSHVEHGSLVDYCIKKNNDAFVKILLLARAQLTQASQVLAGAHADIKAMLDYRPGPGQKTIFDVCSKRIIDANVVRNLILDYNDTTDGSDSESEPIECDPIRLNEGDRYAFRGMHFAPSFYRKDSRAKIKREAIVNNKKTAYSISMLLDSGYTADDDVPEDDSRIKQQKNKHKDFFDKLKAAADVKEKKIGSLAPPQSRNKIVFQSHFYRFIQAYINSYSRLFNHKAIQIDFGFQSSHNPLVSLSWNCEKACCYGVGSRFDKVISSIYRNPHYRRSTKKAKHPNAGYVDIFILPQSYTHAETVDRKTLLEQGLISLSAYYRHEEEVIAFSLVPSEHHQRRCILSLPHLDSDFNRKKAYYKQYGILSDKTLKNVRELIFNQQVSGQQAQEQHKDGLNKLTELAAKGQAQIINQKIKPG